MSKLTLKYVDAIQKGFDYLLATYPELILLGQGLWSPFYVGRSLHGLDQKYGRDRVIDTPISENAVTGIALGAAIVGSKTVAIHPRMDFMILAVDQIVNEAAKWRYMLSSDINLSFTVRGIINRGGEQGAQHSQALHSWFAHIPGLRVVMPATPSDALNLLIQSAECPDPVIYIDDRWCYEYEEEVEFNFELPPLSTEKPQIICTGNDITVVGIGYSTLLCIEVVEQLSVDNISCEVIDLRVLNPLDTTLIVSSVIKTGRLIVVDGGWKNAGMAAEIIASVAESGQIKWKSTPTRITLPDAPAPSSSALEFIYYQSVSEITLQIRKLIAPL